MRLSLTGVGFVETLSELGTNKNFVNIMGGFQERAVFPQDLAHYGFPVNGPDPGETQL